MRRVKDRIRQSLRGQGGFTFIEIISVLLILGVISYFVATRLFMDDAPTQRGEFELLKNHLRYAQSRAMNSEDVWGIKCGTSKRCWLFKWADGVDTVKRLPGWSLQTGPGSDEHTDQRDPDRDRFRCVRDAMQSRRHVQPLTTSPSFSVQAAAGGSAVGTITVTKNTGFIPDRAGGSGNMKGHTRHFRKPRTGRGQGGFTLLEVIVTIAIAAIMGVFFAQFVYTGVTHSADPVYRLQNLSSTTTSWST